MSRTVSAKAVVSASLPMETLGCVTRKMEENTVLTPPSAMMEKSVKASTKMENPRENGLPSTQTVRLNLSTLPP